MLLNVNVFHIAFAMILIVSLLISHIVYLANLACYATIDLLLLLLQVLVVK